MMMRSKTRGFSLVELLVATVILGLGLTSVSMLFVAGIVSGQKAERLSTAVNAVQQQMERLRSAGFSGCVVDPEIFTSDEGYSIIQANGDGSGVIGFPATDLSNGQGTITIDFYNSASGYYPNLKQVTVALAWVGGGVTAGSVSMTGLIANQP